MGSNQIREDILYFLFRNNYWQNRHTPKSNICNKLSQPDAYSVPIPIIIKIIEINNIAIFFILSPY